MEEVKLNKQQEEAVKLIKDWYNGFPNNKKQIFTLAGLAGCGKSFLVNYIVKNVFKFKDSEVAFATPTGKASSVLIKKGSDSTTIHRLIYSPIIKDIETTINNKTIHSKKIEFSKKKSIGTYKLIILDEISMIGKKIMDDLLSYGIPILATGDCGQLPPVAQEGHNLLSNPDYNLTEIVRQAKDSQILTIAHKARVGETIESGNYNDEAIVIDRATINDKAFINYLTTADQVICGTNNTRIKLNTLIRKVNKHTKKLPDNDEKLICELNNYEVQFKDDRFYLVNGLQGYVKNFKILDEKLKLATISFKADFLDDWVDNLLIDYSVFETNNYKYDKHQEVYLMSDGTYKIAQPKWKMSKTDNQEEYKKYMTIEYLNKKRSLGTFMINQFQYGYAISCHKSQGSQWDTVVIIDEHKTFRQDGAKWLYTAITRAAKKVVIIR